MDCKEKNYQINYEVGQFEAEDSDVCEEDAPLFDVASYPVEQQALVKECNRRIEELYAKYRVASIREDMFAKGLRAGMYFCTFDRQENLLSFEFNEETRKMLGYDGIEDLPNEFDSWVKTLVPEEREGLVKLFWDTVRLHHDLPDITHATYRMKKKDGSIIWVTGAGRFVRRPDDSSLEIYMGCYRDITAQIDLKEYLKIVEAIGSAFNFSIYIDVKDMSYRMISSNEYVDVVEKDPDAFVFLKKNVDASVAESFRQGLYNWLDKDKILDAVEKQGSTSMEFYSERAERWFTGIFLVGDRDEDGNVAHLVYGCQDTTETKLQHLAQQKMITEYEAEIYVDSLSKVRNRKYLDDKLIFEPCNSVVMSDIDYFKNVNDTAGHQAGDEAIQKVAEVLERSVRKEDVVLRYGGDEFMIVFFDINRQTLEKKLSYLKSQIKTILIEGHPEVHLSMSFGCALGTELVNNLIRVADEALYEAKKQRDTYTIFEM